MPEDTYAPEDMMRSRLVLAQELSSRLEVDPLLQFVPHTKQKPFIDSALGETFYENWFIAANRSGKSDAGAYIGASLARFGVDSGKIGLAMGGRMQIKDYSTSGWVSGLDFPMLRDTIQPKYFDNGHVPPSQTHPPFIPASEIKSNGWHLGDQVLKLKNGSIIGFKSAEQGARKYQGAEKDWIHFDEEHPKRVYEEATLRVGGRRLRIFHTITLLPPEGNVGGVSWVFPDVIQPWKDGKQREMELFGASIFDNPHIPLEELARLESKYPPGTREWRIRLSGEWLPGMGGARAYPNFNRLMHVRELPPIIERQPLAWICDFNVEPLIHLIGQQQNSIFRVYKELVLEEGNLERMVDLFMEHFPDHRAPIWMYGDATSKGRSRQTGKSDYMVMQNAMLQYPAPLELKVPESNPAIPDRINAVNIAMVNEFGAVQVEIAPECVELIDDFEQVLRDQRGGLKKTTNRRDPYFRRTHASDAFGYWISRVAPVRRRVNYDVQNLISSMPRVGYGFAKRG